MNSLLSSLAKFVTLFIYLAFLLAIVPSFSRAGAMSLSDPAMKGKVIDLGDGRPWLVVQSTAQTGTKTGYVYVMAMYNYGDVTWGSNNQTPTVAISTTSDSGTIYSNLPTTIGGVAKNTAFSPNTWQWDMCSSANPTACSNTTTSTSRLSFVSFREWQGGTGGYTTEPSSGSVGDLFCTAWKGMDCLGSSLLNTFNNPWIRSGDSAISNYAWYLGGSSSFSLNSNYMGLSYGSLPVTWLASTIETTVGSGTFADPYCLAGDAVCVVRYCAKAENQNKLACLPQGSVIDLGDGHPWLWVNSTTQTGSKPGFGYIMSMDNYGNYAWGSNNQTPTTAISTTSDSGTIYSGLPSTIGDMAKATAMASNTWQWNNCSNTGSCVNTTTSTSRLSFVSYKEWQGTTIYAYNGAGGNSEPSSGSVGDLFCMAWKGTDCLGSNLIFDFNIPWTRSGRSDNSIAVWALPGDSSRSLEGYNVIDNRGSLPVAWVASSLEKECGSGTFTDPYHLAGDCNTAPTISALSSPVNNSWVGTTLTVAGTVTDPDSSQTLTIQYQFDGTNSVWNTLTTTASPASNKAYSANINISSLSAGSHTLYVRVTDGTATSSNVSATFQVNQSATQPNPAPILENSIANIGAFASYVSGYSSLILSGTAHDADIGQTLAVQYQIDNPAGNWYNLTSLMANASNQSWTSTIDIATHYPGLAAGVHTLYVRVYDGYGYSSNKSMQFTLDSTAPTNTATLLGGAKCAASNTIYCSPPTAIDLSSSTDAAAGIGSYRTQWTTPFSLHDNSPSWTTINPPTVPLPNNLSTANHTTPAQTHTLFYQTRDKVGHVSSVDSISYYINSPPTISLDSATLDHVITPFNSLIFTGHFTDLDLSQTVSVKATINSIDYSSPLFPTNGHQISFHLIIPFSALAPLAPSDLTNLPLTVTDSAGSSATTYYTGQITTLADTSSQIYLSVMKNIPFSLTIGKVGAFNISFGTTSSVTVSANPNSEIIVSGVLSSPQEINFGVTTLVFTTFDEPAFSTQEVEFF